MTEFNKYLKEARQEFCKEVNKYNVSDNLQLRTACDSFLIAFDQATEKAINYTRCSAPLKGKETMTFEDWVESEGYTKKWDGYFKNGIKSTYWIVKGKYIIYKNELNL